MLKIRFVTDRRRGLIAASGRRGLVAAAAAAAVAATAGIAYAADVPATPAASPSFDGRSGVATRATRYVASYTFDTTDPDGRFPDVSGGGHTLKALGANGGTVRLRAHGTGQAVAFPGVCTGATCPRLVLQAADSAQLNPGADPIRFGASVLLAGDQTTDGQNVLQKGYSTSGSQYKLQVDKLPGRPSCAMTGRNSSTIHLARSSVTVADNRWHAVECRRSGTTLAILVDGTVRGSVPVPAGLTVANSSPLSLGGKGTAANNDQFRGVLDDAWISIG